MSDTLSFQIENRLSQLEIAFKRLEQFGEAHGLGSDVLFDLQLALEEILTNIIYYAYEDNGPHVINVSILLDKGAVTIEVTDSGRPFNPEDIGRPDLKRQFRERKLGGLGLHLVRNLMGEVRYRRVNEKNILVMTKRISNGSGHAREGRNGNLGI